MQNDVFRIPNEVITIIKEIDGLKCVLISRYCEKTRYHSLISYGIVGVKGDIMEYQTIESASQFLKKISGKTLYCTIDGKKKTKNDTKLRRVY